MLRHIAGENRTYLSLDDLSLRELAREDPKLFLARYSPPLLIDEIQYAPELLPYIKLAIDENRKNGEFWLTGSQQFHMMRGISESLAGRIGIVNLLGFSQTEKCGQTSEAAPFLPSPRYEEKPAKSPDDIFHNIWQGSFPVPFVDQSVHVEFFFNSYLQTYLQRDIRELTRVGDLHQFTRFVRACAARTGQILNYSNLAKDVDISVMTAKHWLSLLEASFQILLVPPFHSNITKRLIKTPKLYFLDTGLCAFLTGWLSPETVQQGAMRGALFETYVITEIIKSWWFAGRNPGFFYYRDKDGREIDLVLEQDNILYAVEVKSAATVKRSWAEIFSVLNRFPQKKGARAVICLCDRPQPLDSLSTAIPVSHIGLAL